MITDDSCQDIANDVTNTTISIEDGVIASRWLPAFYTAPMNHHTIFVATSCCWLLLLSSYIVVIVGQPINQPTTIITAIQSGDRTRQLFLNFSSDCIGNLNESVVFSSSLEHEILDGRFPWVWLNGAKALDDLEELLFGLWSTIFPFVFEFVRKTLGGEAPVLFELSTNVCIGHSITWRREYALIELKTMTT